MAPVRTRQFAPSNGRVHPGNARHPGRATPDQNCGHRSCVQAHQFCVSRLHRLGPGIGLESKTIAQGVRWLGKMFSHTIRCRPPESVPFGEARKLILQLFAFACRKFRVRRTVGQELREYPVAMATVESGDVDELLRTLRHRRSSSNGGRGRSGSRKGRRPRHRRPVLVCV